MTRETAIYKLSIHKKSTNFMKIECEVTFGDISVKKMKESNPVHVSDLFKPGPGRLKEFSAARGPRTGKSATAPTSGAKSERTSFIN